LREQATRGISTSLVLESQQDSPSSVTPNASGGRVLLAVVMMGDDWVVEDFVVDSVPPPNTIMARRFETLESFCSALRNNDPSVTEVDTDYYGEGYGNELGAALASNSCVSTLNVRLDTLVDINDGRVDGLLSLYLFTRTSPSLRSVQLWSDPLLISEVELARHIGGVFLRLVALNPNVVDFWLDADVHWGRFAESILSTTSIRSFHFALLVCEFGDHLQTVANAIGANRSIQTLKLDAITEDDEDVLRVNTILQALNNHATLLKLSLEVGIDDSPEMIADLAGFLRSNVVLEELSLTGFLFKTEGLDLISDALQSNQSITTLSFAHCFFSLERARDFAFCIGQTKRIRKLEITGGIRALRDYERHIGAADVTILNFLEVEVVTVRQ
jgi:hypothetical protein